MKNTSNTKKKKITKKEFLKRIFKFLFIGYAIVIIIMLLLNGVIKDKRTIQEKIGSSEPYSISIKDALNIKEYGLMTYASFLKNEKIKSAYNMLSEEYKKVVSYEEYKETLAGINFETFNMKDIKIKAENTYVATVVYEKNGEQTETTYILYLNKINPKIITISPDKFIYGYKDLKFKMDNVELKLQDCTVYTDKIKLVAKIKNTSLLETMTFNNIGVGYDTSINKNENIDIVLSPGEEKEFTVEYDSSYYIPNNIKLKRLKDDETMRTYTFYLEKK